MNPVKAPTEANTGRARPWGKMVGFGRNNRWGHIEPVFWSMSQRIAGHEAYSERAYAREQQFAERLSQIIETDPVLQSILQEERRDRVMTTRRSPTR